MTGDSKNVIAFAPRPRPEPGLEFVEFILDEDGICGLRMSLVDENKNVIELVFKLADLTPADFDLDRLRAKWISWRESSDIAR